MFLLVHLITEEIDSGPVIYKNQIEIEENDSYQDIRIKVYLHFQIYAKLIK